MQEWIKALLQSVSMLLGGPQSFLEVYLLAALGLLVLLIVLNKVGGAFGAANTGMGPAVMTAFPGLILLFLLLAAARIYLVPRLDENLAAWVYVGVCVLGSLLLAAPILMKVFRLGYFASTFTWAIAVAALAAVIYLGGAAFSLVGSLKGDAHKAEERKDALQEYINLR